LLLIILPVASACSSKSEAASGGKNTAASVKQSTVKAQVSGNTVTVPVSQIDKYGNTHFRVDTSNDYYMFMAYEYGDKIYVRADICPPCGSESFTLKNGTLVCDACGTVFNAQTGAGIRGACVKYTKQPVNFQLSDGNIVMDWTDMTSAYQKTIRPN
jgi:nitrite reductase/ring-hydroxylating ferredoxin subunit